MPRIAVLTASAAAVLALATGLVAGCSGADPASYNEADVTFASEMVSHHEQGVAMADMAAERPLEPEVRDLVEEIRADQSAEAEQMSGWLEEWGKPAPDPDPDAAMDMGGAMDQMLSHDQMDDLASTPDADFERAWLAVMIAHHHGALEMARAEVEAGRYPEAVDMAREIETTQAEEITRMKRLLAG